MVGFITFYGGIEIGAQGSNLYLSLGRDKYEMVAEMIGTPIGNYTSYM